MKCIVCGPESSGNRLLVRLLLTCGLRGSADYNQPTTFDIDYSEPWAIINHYDKLRGWIDAFRNHGHDVTMLVPVREFHACTRSMTFHHAHRPTIENAGKSILQIVGINVSVALAFDVPCEIIPYEALNPQMLAHFFARHQLTPRNTEEVEINNQNERWYA